MSASSPWQHRVHPVTSSVSGSPKLEVKNHFVSAGWHSDWPETSLSHDRSSEERSQEQPLLPETLPVSNHLTSGQQEQPQGQQEPKRPNERSNDGRSGSCMSSEARGVCIPGNQRNGGGLKQVTKKDLESKDCCYDKCREQLQTGGGGGGCNAGGNTYDPPKRRLGNGNPTLCSPFALNSPLYRPYPYVHGRYGNSESPIASLQCGLNKLAAPEANSTEKESEEGKSSEQITMACNDKKRCKNSKKQKSKGSPDQNDKSRNANKVPPKKMTKLPENYMGLAILICVLFNCPLGMAAILVSRSATRHFSEGNMAIGRKRALCSLVLSLVAIVVSVLVIIMVVFLIVANSKN